MTAPEIPSARPAPAKRLRAAIDRVPTKWFAALGTAVFLAATAAFGGLADAAVPEPAALDAGEVHTSAQLSIEVEDVVVIDDLPELYLDLEDGERALIVLAHVTNEWTEPQSASSRSLGFRDVVAVRVGEETLPREDLVSIARVDDAEDAPTLQPGIRVPMAFIWRVRAGDVLAGDEAVVQLFDQTLYTAQVVTEGESWTDAALAATVTMEVTDLGGVEDDGEGDGS